jgi:glucose/arabinose dehydrogenase
MRSGVVRLFVVASAFVPATCPGLAQRTPAAGGWRNDAPGVVHRIAAEDLPAPATDRSASNAPFVVARPKGAEPHVSPGFTVGLFAAGPARPRIVRVAPNGDIFIAESAAGRIRVLRAADGAPKPQQMEIFATGLDRPFGLAFYPPGPDPQFLYVANNNSVERFPYHNGDLKAREAPQTVVPRLSATSGYHWTRDLVFSADGRLMYVSIGSGSNDAERMGRLSPQEIRTHEATFGVGAAWGGESGRAQVLAFDPEGGGRQVLATGLRNCVGLAVQPQTRAIWCSTNERDGFGDDVPPDYVTRVREGAFYGWPWFYTGRHEDPRHAGERPDLADRVTVPDVLIAAHSAPLAMTFYQGSGVAAFPPPYQGDAFVALHGSWNRSTPTGYKLIRIRLRDGVPEGYEDFLTGFVSDDDHVWARPVGVAVAHDGALLVTDDGNGTIWRIAGPGTARE